MSKQENPQYIDGQEAIVNLEGTNDESIWQRAKVTDPSPPRGCSGIIIDKIFGLTPVEVTIDPNAQKYPGMKVIIYSSRNRGVIRPTEE